MTDTVHFWDNDNCTGEHQALTGSWLDLRDLPKGPLDFGNWNDEIRSIRVDSGRWRFFEHDHFHGAYVTLGPGTYNNATEMKFPANTISSIEHNPPQ